jgi:hypothetical protein
MSSTCDAQQPWLRSERHELQPSSIVKFVGENALNSQSAPSAQEIFAEEKAIVTTRTCFNHSVRKWFRWMGADAQPPRGAKSACGESGTPLTPRGAVTTLLTGTHGLWIEAGDLLHTAGLGVPCKVRRHDYCLPAARFAHAPPSETIWRRGITLVANEIHTDNFHHFNRDMLFISRMLARGTLNESDIGTVVLADGSEVAEWAVEHARAVLGPSLLRRTLLMPHRRTGGLPPRKARLSNESLLLSARGGAGGRAPRATAAPKYTCFEALLEKLVTDPVDRDDLRWLRRRAHLHCGHGGGGAAQSDDEGRRPDLLLLILRGDSSLGDRPTTARQVDNAAELRRALTSFARARGLRFAATSFGGMSYCEQVALAARARILVGVHGQGITNGQFMGDDGLVVELFHGGAQPYWSRFDYVGHQPLFLGAGRPYVAAPLAESACPMMRWKHVPSCRSFVNGTKVVQLLEEVTARLHGMGGWGLGAQPDPRLL